MFALVDDKESVIQLAESKFEVAPYLKWVEATAATLVGDTLVKGKFVSDIRTDAQKKTDNKNNIRDQVESRIVSFANHSTQINMLAEASLGLMSATDLDSYKEGVQWVKGVRAKGKDLVGKNTADSEKESYWDRVPTKASKLAERY